MSITPRTDFIAHKGYTERTYICEMTELARILETELVAAKAEIENLIWNLAGCSTIAHSGKPTDYSHELARPALHDVNRLAARAEKAKAENAVLLKRLDSIQKSHFLLSKDNAALLNTIKNIALLTANGDAERANWVALGILNNPRAAIDAAMKETKK